MLEYVKPVKDMTYLEVINAMSEICDNYTAFYTDCDDCPNECPFCKAIKAHSDFLEYYDNIERACLVFRVMSPEESLKVLEAELNGC